MAGDVFNCVFMKEVLMPWRRTRATATRKRLKITGARKGFCFHPCVHTKLSNTSLPWTMQHLCQSWNSRSRRMLRKWGGSPILPRTRQSRSRLTMPLQSRWRQYIGHDAVPYISLVEACLRKSCQQCNKSRTEVLETKCQRPVSEDGPTFQVQVLYFGREKGNATAFAADSSVAFRVNHPGLAQCCNVNTFLPIITFLHASRWPFTTPSASQHCSTVCQSIPNNKAAVTRLYSMWPCFRLNLRAEDRHAPTQRDALFSVVHILHMQRAWNLFGL